MIIYKITLFLSMNGWRKIVQPIQAKETDKLFIFRESQFVGTIHLKKIKLLEIDSKLRDSHERISLFTYCRKEQINEAQSLIEKELVNRVERITAEYNGMMKQYRRPVGYIYPKVDSMEYQMPESGKLNL